MGSPIGPVNSMVINSEFCISLAETSSINLGGYVYGYNRLLSAVILLQFPSILGCR